jgi:hypothetical protein
VNSNAQFLLLITSCGVFMVCVIIRMFLLKQIVESTGGKWDWQSPLQNISEERRAINVLSANNLRSRLLFLNVVALSSWLTGIMALVVHALAH